MEPDRWRLYELMLTSRLFEELVYEAWHAGHISGEMHMGIGEEGISAGVLDHLRDGDALALDHRGTPPLIMRGVTARSLMAEFLGRPDGLCRGQGGHMHLYAPEFLAASSGIVGASGPAAVGFALAGQLQSPGSVTVAFFGEGALNEGMLMESLNLAAVWHLPVLFVCKDDGWAIFTPTETTSPTSPVERAEGFGLRAQSVDGTDVEAVWQTAGKMVNELRDGSAPMLLHATCIRPHAHFLGDPLLRMAQRKRGIGLGGLLRSMIQLRGESIRGRLGAGVELTGLLRQSLADRDPAGRDPVARLREQLIKLDSARLEGLEAQTAELIILETADLLADLVKEEQR